MKGAQADAARANRAIDRDPADDDRDARIPAFVLRTMWGRRAKQSHLSVAACLYMHANKRGHCLVSIDTIVELTKLDERSVYRALKWLESGGLLRRGKAPGTFGKVNTYQLVTRAVLAIPDTGVTVDDGETVTRTSPNPDTGVARPLTPVSGEQEELKQALNSAAPQECHTCGGRSTVDVVNPDNPNDIGVTWCPDCHPLRRKSVSALRRRSDRVQSHA